MEKYSQEFNIHASSQISRFWLLSFSVSWFLSYYWMFNNFCLLFIFNQAYSHSFSVTLNLQYEFDTFENKLSYKQVCKASSTFDIYTFICYNTSMNYIVKWRARIFKLKITYIKHKLAWRPKLGFDELSIFSFGENNSCFLPTAGWYMRLIFGCGIKSFLEYS